MNFRFLVIFLFFFIAGSALAQKSKSNNIDRFRQNIIDSEKSDDVENWMDSLKVRLLKEGADKRIEIWTSLINEKEVKNDLVFLMAHLSRASVHGMKGNVHNKLRDNKKSIEFAERIKDSSWTIVSYAMTGSSEISLKHYDKGLYWLKKAETITSQPRFQDDQWKLDNQFASYYAEQGRYDEQIKSLRAMWENIKNNKRYEHEKSFTLYNIAHALHSSGQYDEIPFYTQKIMELYPNKDFNKIGGHLPLYSFYSVDTEQKDEGMLLRSLQISDSLSYNKNYFFVLLLLDDFYKEKMLSQKRVMALETGLKKAKLYTDYDFTPRIMKSLSEAYIEIGEPKKGYEMLVDYHNLQDSLLIKEAKLKVADLEVKYETAKKEKTISDQSAELAVKSREKTYLIGGILILLLLLIGGYFIQRNRVKYNRNLAEKEKQIHESEIQQLQDKNKLLALNSMVEGQEVERLRIAKDLHDGLGGLLANVKAQFSKVQEEITRIENMNIYDKANNMIDEACVEVRRIAHNMVPQSIEVSGLKGALIDMSANLKNQNYTCTFDINDIPEGYPEEKSIMIYRVIQELVQNIRKHAEAKEIFVQVFKRDNLLCLTVEDDGIGFDIDKAKELNNLGLKSIDSRVSFLNGSILYDSAINKGTTVNIEIPLND